MQHIAGRFRRVRLHAVLAPALVLVLALGLAACGAAPGDEDDLLRRGLTAEIATLDPHFNVLVETSSVLLDLYEGLVRLDPGGNVVPGVAQSWMISDDGLRYTFSLRGDARWSDGSPLTADDFVWSFQRVVDPSTASPHAGKLDMVAGASAIVADERLPETLGVVAVDERTLRIELEYPAPYLLSVLTHTALAPLHAASVERFDRLFTRAGNLISNGPYMLAAREDHQYVELVRNPHYWDSSRAVIQRVRYIPYEEEFAQFAAYRVGQIDMTDVVPASGNEIVRDQFPSELHLRPTRDTFYYAFNLRQGPLAAAPALREALSTALRREIIVDQVTGVGQPPAYSFVPPMFGGYDPPRMAMADLDREARDAHGRELLRKESSLPRKLRVLHNTNEGIRRITVAATSMWREALGVETELMNQEFSVFLQSLRDPSAWDVARLSWRADFDDPYAFLEIFTTRSPNNFVGFSDPVYDDLIARSLRELEPIQRNALLHEAERRLLDAHAIAPVFFYVDRVLAKPWVKVGDRATVKPLPTADLRWLPAEKSR